MLQHTSRLRVMLMQETCNIEHRSTQHASDCTHNQAVDCMAHWGQSSKADMNDKCAQAWSQGVSNLFEQTKYSALLHHILTILLTVFSYY